MAIVTESWINQMLDGSPLDGTEVEGYLSLLAAGVNDIDNSQINANAGIDGTKLADNSITGAKILDLAITTAKIANLAVTAAKIAAGTITVDKMASNSVDTSQIVDGSVTAAKLASATLAESNVVWDATTGLKALHIGAAQRRLIYGTKAISWGSGVDTATATITFASDAATGIYSEDFSSTTGMVWQFGWESLSLDTGLGVWVTSSAVGSIAVRCFRTDGAGTATGTLHWAVMGSVA
jgi:hypothetical protein